MADKQQATSPEENSRIEWQKIKQQAAFASLPTRPTKPAETPRKRFYDHPPKYPQAGPTLRYTSEGLSAVADTSAPSTPTATTDGGLYVNSDHRPEASLHDNSATTKVNN
jgi:hypothetical protein